MDGATPYPLHRVRWILRSVASLFLLLSFSLYTADGTACVNSINAINNSDFNDGFIEDPVSACWTDPLFGDLRPDLIVRTSISLSMDESQMIELPIGKLSLSWIFEQEAFLSMRKFA